MSKFQNNNYHHGNLKTALLKSAQKIIAKKGIESLSLRTLATSVGVSHMAPYAHFKNKSELYISVASEGFNTLNSQLLAIQRKTSKPQNLLLNYGVTYIDFATKNPQLYKLMLSQMHSETQTPTKSIETKQALSKVTLSKSELTLHQVSKKTYLLLRECFSHQSSDESTINIQTQGAWAFVHGMASLLITGHFKLNNDTSIKSFLTTAIDGFELK